MFRIVSVGASQAVAVEHLGTKAKFWFHDGERLLLFKAEERGTGEDWAEKVACELAALLGLPHVHYELAYDEDLQRPGVICASCTPAPLSLVHGNQLLLARDPDYPAEAERRYHARSQTVDSVFDVVRGLDMPAPVWCERLPHGIAHAVDVFVGYLMLDALIANQDRHHENWGAIWDGQRQSLAPSFDHGAALARNLSDEERDERLRSRDERRRIPYFASRARSALYAEAGAAQPLSTLDAWRCAAALAPTAATIWGSRLADLDEEAMTSILRRIPPSRMSSICRRFTLELVAENRRRILEPDS